jgi:translation initiation factor eIF-2B subunit delta
MEHNNVPESSGQPALASSDQNPPPKSQKSMTKAERREIQERQRAEKAAKATEKPQTGAGKGASKQAGPSTPRKPKGAQETVTSRAVSGQAAPPKTLRDPKEGATAHDDLSRKTHGLRIFSHFGLTKSVSGKGDIHPAIIRLALLFSSFKISGANARCMATLAAFKNVCTLFDELSSLLHDRSQVIQDYVTPPNQMLSRHLMTYLSPQISHLVAARPMSVTMGNAIRELKVEISNLDIDLPEQDVRSTSKLTFHGPDTF